MATEKRLIDANAKFIEKHFAKRLIDGYALVDVIENIDWYHIGSLGNLEHGANSQLHTPLFKSHDIFEALANAPTVDAVEVVHGRWEVYPDWRWLRCTNCKVEFEQSHFPQIRHYCPNCGAKMDGDGNG